MQYVLEEINTSGLEFGSFDVPVTAQYSWSWQRRFWAEAASCSSRSRKHKDRRWKRCRGRPAELCCRLDVPVCVAHLASLLFSSPSFLLKFYSFYFLFSAVLDDTISILLVIVFRFGYRYCPVL